MFSVDHIRTIPLYSDGIVIEKSFKYVIRDNNISSYNRTIKDGDGMQTDDGWRHYTNGNVFVSININDGTKIRFTEDDDFSADFPESVDMKITDRCGIGCDMCHEGSTGNGRHADLDTAFLNTLKPYTEVAVGGGSVTSHPGIECFLKNLKERRILSNITVHEKELFDNQDKIQGWIDDGLVNGIGISIHSLSNDRMMEFTRKNTNSVLHAVAGYTPLTVIESYGRDDRKLLILGYKNWGRGANYYNGNRKEVEDKIASLERNIESILDMFSIVSFDNLALDQLNIRKHVNDDVWNMCYQGHDATHTMYIDLVRREFAATSTSPERFNIEDGIENMFAHIKGTMNHRT